VRIIISCDFKHDVEDKRKQSQRCKCCYKNIFFTKLFNKEIEHISKEYVSDADKNHQEVVVIRWYQFHVEFNKIEGKTCTTPDHAQSKCINIYNPVLFDSSKVSYNRIILLAVISRSNRVNGVIIAD